MSDDDSAGSYLYLYACQCGDTLCKEPNVYCECCKAKGLRDQNLHPYHDEEVERLQRAWDAVWMKNKALQETNSKLMVENQMLRGQLWYARSSAVAEKRRSRWSTWASSCSTHALNTLKRFLRTIGLAG